MNEISWCTIMMFSASIPSYKNKEKKEKDGEELSIHELSNFLK